MANLPSTPTWSPDVYQIEPTDAVLGGPDGVINIQAKQLADRTAYLKQAVEAAGAVADDADTKATSALAQIAGIETAAGSAQANAAEALTHKQGAQAAQALAEQARNAAQAAQAQAGDNAGFAYQASQTAQLKATEATSAATAATTAASQAVSERNQVVSLADTKKAEIISAATTGQAAIEDAAATGLAAVEVASADGLTALQSTEQAALAQMIPARDATIAASQTATTKASEATSAAATATAQAATASTQAGLATTAKTAAEAARDAAQLSAGVYATTAAGLAATTNGKYFSVPSGASSEYLILYLNNAGVAAEQKRYPAAAVVDDLATQTYQLTSDATDRVAFALTDLDGFSTLRVSVDGNLVAPTGIEDAAGTVVRRTNSDGSVDTPAVQEVTTTTPAGIVAYTDIDGFAGQIVAADGTVTSYTPPPARPALTFDGKLQHVVSYGQSLSLGWASSPVLTTSQRHSALKFSGGVRPFDSGTDPAVIYSSLVPLTETASGAAYETPMAGMLEMLYDSIEAENGYGYQDIDFRFLGSCAGKDGEPIANLVKGSSYYTRFLQQIQYGKTRANAAGWEYRVKAFCWTQGEADYANSQATYLAALRQLRTDLQTDIQAQTGFNDPLLCIHYQTYSNESNTAASPASLAQLQAHDEEPTKFALACPVYFMNSVDVHLTNVTSAWMGAYYGLVYKRVVLEGGSWAPTKPVRVYSPAANTIDVTFNVPSGQLAWDYEYVSPQPNKGFSVVDGSNALQTISSVEIVGRRTVRITLSGAVPAGARVRYGVRARTGLAADNIATVRRTFGSACGNLRDTAGNVLKFRKLGLELPMHNWSVIFDKGVA